MRTYKNRKPQNYRTRGQKPKRKTYYVVSRGGIRL